MSADMLKIGLILVVIGIFILVSSIIIYSVLTLSDTTSNISGGVGGCIVILFIPICFGVGSIDSVSTLILFSVILSLIVLILFVIVPIAIMRSVKKIKY